MFCSKCGKKIEDGTKFCPGCGSKAEAKKETVKAEPVKTVKKEESESNGLGIAGMVMGIISIILAFFLSVFILIIPIVGLILSCVAKGKKGFKIAGIITNIVAILLSIIMAIIGIVMVGSLIGGAIQDTINDNEDIISDIKDEIEDKVDDVKKATKSGYPYGTWTCVPYSSMNLQNYDYDNIKSNNKEDLTVLKLNTDNSFQYGPYVDNYKNYYKGNFTYEIETSKNEQYKSQGYAFIDVDGKILEFKNEGVDQNVPDTARLHFEMELWETYGYDKALIGFYDDYSINNMYFCER